MDFTDCLIINHFLKANLVPPRLHHTMVPPPCSNMEAYLLLEAARSDRQISLMRKNLAYEIIHRNTIALQLNRIVLEKAEEDFQRAEELIGQVRLTVRQSGHSTAFENFIKEPWPHRGEFFLEFSVESTVSYY